MFGLVSHQPVAARALLREAPRSLRALAREHRDGWGVALRTETDWIIHRGIECATDSEQFAAVADRATGQVVIAHVRQKTVGCTALANTHPFRRDAFVFAHNGSISAIPAVAARASERRLRQIEGDTDSERLFAMIMTHIDDAGDVEAGVVAAVRELHALGPIGSTNFLLSCGARLFAHRSGRTLFALTGPSVVIASEALTDGEAWCELAEQSLCVVETSATGPQLRVLI